jgi:hypothetical protein
MRAIIALLMIGSTAGAQGVGVVRGQVRATKTGDPVAGATVLVVGARLGAIADAAGRYTIPNIPAGAVTLRARFPGFADGTQAIVLAAGDTQTVDFTLDQSVATLGEVRTEAKVAEREAFETKPNLGVTLISGKVLSSVPRLGEADVLRAAQLLPGVEARNDFTAGLNVRGGEVDQNLILLDGYPIFNPFHLGGLFGTFIDGSVGDLVLRTGGFPAQFGGRLSSVLDVRSPDETRPGIHGESTISMLATSAVLEGSVNDGLGSWLIAGRRTYADKVLAALGQDAVPYYFDDGQAHFSYHLGPKTTVALTAYQGSDDLEANLAKADSVADGGGLSFAWGNRVVGTTVTHEFSEHLSATQQVAYTIFKTNLDLGGGALQLDNQVRETSMHGALAFTGHERHSPTIGYDVTKDDMAYSVGSTDAAVSILDQRQHPMSFGGYVDDVWKQSDKLLLESGLRFERLQGSGWQAFSPRLSAKYFLTHDLAVTAAVGRYSQWLHSLAREDIPVRLFDFWTASDAQIPVSRATHYVLGGESWFGTDRFIRLETHLKHYDRLLEPNPADDPKVQGDEYLALVGKSYGADLLLRQIERGRWGGWIAYTYTYNTRTNDVLTFYPGQDRRNDVNIVASYRPTPRTVWSMRFGYATGTPYTDIVGEMPRRFFDPATNQWDSEQLPTTQPIGGARNAARYPPTQRLDLTVTHDWGNRVKLTPFLSLINAYNAKNVFLYQFDYSAAPPTRTAYSQLPLLPTIGLTVAW